MNKIPDKEMLFEYIHSSGPGGQNVNKVASAVQLRFDVSNSPSLSEEIKLRLSRLAGKRMSDEGVLVIEARRYREQERNRQDAINRLNCLIEKASNPPVKRLPTRPTTNSVQSRLEGKKRRSETKRNRTNIREDWE